MSTTAPSQRTALTERISLAMQDVIASSVLNNERIARMMGLNVVDLQTYGVIARAGRAMTPGEVSAATFLPSSTTTRVLDRLAAKDLVVRTPDPTDRRKVLVEPRPVKVAEVGSAYSGVMEQMAALHEQFTPEELDVVARYLEAVHTIR